MESINKTLWKATDSSPESEDDYEFFFIASLPGEEDEKEYKEKSNGVCPIFSRRRQQKEYYSLLQEIRLSDPKSHFRYLRMCKERFDCLLSMLCYYS